MTSQDLSNPQQQPVVCLQTVHARIPFPNAILNFFETQSNQQHATKFLEEPILGKTVSAVLEVFSALEFGELIEDGAAELPKLVDRAFRSVSKQLLEFRKRQLDRSVR